MEFCITLWTYLFTYAYVFYENWMKHKLVCLLIRRISLVLRVCVWIWLKALGTMFSFDSPVAPYLCNFDHHNSECWRWNYNISCSFSHRLNCTAFIESAFYYLYLILHLMRLLVFSFISFSLFCFGGFSYTSCDLDYYGFWFEYLNSTSNYHTLGTNLLKQAIVPVSIAVQELRCSFEEWCIGLLFLRWILYIPCMYSIC